MLGKPPQDLDLRVSLVIPAHNEEARLSASVELYCRALTRAFGNAFELLIVCNGCTDSTPDIARCLSEANPSVRVLVIHEAVGKGGAVVAGFRAARGERVAFADADAATDPSSLLELINKIPGYDVAIGSRRAPGSLIAQKQPLPRRLLGATFYQLTRRLFGLTYLDTQCGAKVLSRAAAALLTEEITEYRWTFDVDLLLGARRLGLVVVEVPVVWTDVPGSKVRVLPTAVQVIRSFWRLKNKDLTRRPIPAFHVAQPAVVVQPTDLDLESAGAN